MVEINPSIFLTYRAKDIQTTMSSNPICIEIDEDYFEALHKLEKFDFDQAPVLSENVVIGWLLRSSLKEKQSVGEAFNRLAQSDLISSDSPLNYLLQRLIEKQLIFLVGASGIEGFVVRSDIDRHVSRSHLYLLVSGLQIVLTRIIERDFTTKSSLLELMSASSLKAYEEAKIRGDDANPVEYLSIFAACQAASEIDGFLEFIGMSPREWNRYKWIIKGIRNWVAHNNQAKLPKEITFPKIVESMATTEKLINRLSVF